METQYEKRLYSNVSILVVFRAFVLTRSNIFVSSKQERAEPP